MPLQIIRNDITKMSVDAIVNAATLLFWVAAVWTAACIVPPDRNCLQNSQVQAAVEMWRYNPRKLSTRNTVDELSLALALREDTDERVEEAVEEMLNELWRKIDGYRN